MNLPTRLPLLMLLFPALAVAQTAPPAAPPELAKQESTAPEQKPVTLDAPAIAYGAALEKQASPWLKAWAKSYAKKKMRKQVLDPAAIRAAVDTQYPNASPEARSNAAYLLTYTACKDQYTNLVRLESHLGIRGRRNPFAARTTITPGGGGGTQRYSGPTVTGTGQMTPAQGNASTSTAYLFSDGMPANDPFVPANANTRPMREYIAALRTRADAYTRLLNEAHKQMGAAPPGAIREIR